MKLFIYSIPKVLDRDVLKSLVVLEHLIYFYFCIPDSSKLLFDLMRVRVNFSSLNRYIRNLSSDIVLR